MMAGWLRLWTRGLRAAPAMSIGVALLVLVTALVAATVPRVLGRASADALVSELAGASSASRNLELRQVGRIPATGGAALDSVDQAGDRLRAQLADPIPPVVDATGTLIDTPLWRTTAGDGLTAVVSLRIQPSAGSHLVQRAGRLPTGSVPATTDPTPGAAVGSRIRLFEVAVSTAAAKALALHIGDQLVLDGEPSDALAAHRSVRLAVVVVGTYDVADPSDPFWMDDGLVGRPGIYALSGFTEYVRAMALLSPDAYPALIDATLDARLPMTYRWRSYVDPGRVRPDQLDPLVSALRLAGSTFPPADLTATASVQAPTGVGHAMLASGLPGLLQTHRDRWAGAAADSAAVWAGVALTVLACLAVAAEAVARRRLPALRIARFRGASQVQAVAGVLVESVVLVVPAVVVGTAVAILLVPVADAEPTLVAAALGAVATMAALVVAGLRGSGITPTAMPAEPGAGQQARRILEAAIVVLAVAGAILLRGSVGPLPGAPTAATAGLAPAATAPGVVLASDPLLAATPALLGLAVVIACAHVVPAALGAGARIAARGRALPTVLGLWRAAREGGALAVLAVTLATAAVPAFVGLVADRLDTGATASAWRQVGADFAITGLPSELDAIHGAAIAGVAATASVGTTTANASTGGTVTVIVVDPAALRAVESGTPADATLPAGLDGDTPSGSVPSGTIPAALSSDLAAELAAGGNGEGTSASTTPVASSSGVAGTPSQAASALKLQLGGSVVTLAPVGSVAVVPGVASVGRFVVVSSTRLHAVAPTAVPAASTLLVRAPDLDEAALRAALASIPGGSLTTVSSRVGVEAALRAGPVVGALVPAIVAAAVVVVPYGALAVILAVALALDARRREAARLAVLGLSNRGAIAAALTEFLPAAALGAIAGSLLGLGLAAFSEPALGLAALLGTADLGGAESTNPGRLLPFVAAAVPVAAAAVACVVLAGRATAGEGSRE